MPLLKTAISTLLAGGLLMAILMQFDWDPFAVATWVIDWVLFALGRTADFFLQSDTFRSATEGP